MKIEKEPVEIKKWVTISEHVLMDIMTDVAVELTRTENCPPAMVLAFGIYSAEVLAKIFNDKGEK